MEKKVELSILMQSELYELRARCRDLETSLETSKNIESDLQASLVSEQRKVRDVQKELGLIIEQNQRLSNELAQKTDMILTLEREAELLRAANFQKAHVAVAKVGGQETASKRVEKVDGWSQATDEEFLLLRQKVPLLELEIERLNEELEAADEQLLKLSVRRISLKAHETPRSDRSGSTPPRSARERTLQPSIPPRLQFSFLPQHLLTTEPDKSINNTHRSMVEDAVPPPVERTDAHAAPNSKGKIEKPLRDEESNEQSRDTSSRVHHKDTHTSQERKSIPGVSCTVEHADPTEHVEPLQQQPPAVQQSLFVPQTSSSDIRAQPRVDQEQEMLQRPPPIVQQQQPSQECRSSVATQYTITTENINKRSIRREEALICTKRKKDNSLTASPSVLFVGKRGLPRRGKMLWMAASNERERTI